MTLCSDQSTARKRVCDAAVPEAALSPIESFTSHNVVVEGRGSAVGLRSLRVWAVALIFAVMAFTMSHSAAMDHVSAVPETSPGSPELAGPVELIHAASAVCAAAVIGAFLYMVSRPRPSLSAGWRSSNLLPPTWNPVSHFRAATRRRLFEICLIRA